jgi:D-alanine transaminase
MNDIGYYNGATGPIETMMIPMNDRGFYFGDGVYDATYAAGGVIYAVEDHLDRFFRSCRKLEIAEPMPRAKLTELLQSLVDKVDAPTALMVYWQATRGTAMRSHVFPAPSVPSNLMVTVRPNPMRAIDRKYRLISMEDTRFLHCDIKTLNLIPNVMASQRAKEAGCDEAVFHRGERVTECAHSNIHIIAGGRFVTAPLDNLILPGTARKHLLRLADGAGIPTEERAFTMKELIAADEIVVSSAGTLCNAVERIDGIAVGGKASDALRELQTAAVGAFESYTGAKFDRYSA